MASGKRATSKGKLPAAVNWVRLTDEELLQRRVRDLQLSIEGSVLEKRTKQLYHELERKGLVFRPPFYLADEWLCPDREPIIGIPFCLAHSRLRQLEKKMMLEVEGGTDTSFMKLLRHECGHAINFAYRFFKKTRWRELFGAVSMRYSDSYSYQPYSRRYVIHLGDHYAQCHPDEDFAETFAVWLTPNSQWREKYKDWPVIKKLHYVDHLMQTAGQTEPPVRAGGKPPWSAARMTSTLAGYYERKRKGLGTEFQGYYDSSLRGLFLSFSGEDSLLEAGQLLRMHRKRIMEEVSRWTGHRKYDIYQLISRLIRRCDALDLYAEPDHLVGITALVTAIAGNTLRPQRGHMK